MVHNVPGCDLPEPSNPGQDLPELNVKWSGKDGRQWGHWDALLPSLPHQSQALFTPTLRTTDTHVAASVWCEVKTANDGHRCPSTAAACVVDATAKRDRLIIELLESKLQKEQAKADELQSMQMKQASNEKQREAFGK